MRLLLAPLSLGLALATPAYAGVPPLGSGAASSPVRVQPLAPGELLLELGAIGTATAPADTVSLTVTLTAEGATPERARAALQDLERRATEAMRAAGVPAVSISRRMVRAFELSEMATGMVPLMEESGPAAAPPMHRAGSRFIVRLSGVARLDALRRALRPLENATVSQPTYALTDPGPARRAARAEALARMRADAEAYAAALNMRLVRIVRITERSGSDLFGLALSEAPALMRRGFNPESRSDPDIDVAVMVGVDFALAPQ